MTISNENTKTATQAPAAAVAPQQVPVQQAATAAQPQLKATTGWSSINNRMRRSGKAEGSDARSNAALTAFIAARETAIEQQDLDDDFQVYRFDRTANQVAMASIIVAKLSVSGNKRRLVIKPIPITDSSVPMKNKFTTVPNGYNTETIESKPDGRDIFTAQYWDRMVNFIRNATSNFDAEVYSAGPQLLPESFDLTDATAVRQLLIKMVNSVDDRLAILNNEEPLRLSAELADANEILTAQIDYRSDKQPLETATGLPIRSDMVVRLKRGKRNAQFQENEFFSAEDTINEVAMFANLEYAPQAPTQQVWGQPQQPQAPFIPTIVVTAVRQANWVLANTPEMWFFSLSNAFRVTFGHSWAKCYMPEVGRAKDPRDIGAIGLLLSGAKLETKSEAFSDQDFVALMGAGVQTNPVFQIDLNPLGDNSYMDNMLLDALENSPRRAAATEAIVRILTNLYGREFLNHFNPAEDWIVRTTGTDYRTGFYPSESGQMRDPRDLDTLAALNGCDGILAEFWDWYATRADLSIPEAQRARKSEMYDQRYLGNVTYTDRVTRVTLNPKLIMAMDICNQKAGLSVAMDNVSSIYGQQRFTGNTHLQGLGVTGIAQIAQYQQQGSYAPQHGGLSGTSY